MKGERIKDTAFLLTKEVDLMLAKQGEPIFRAAITILQFLQLHFFFNYALSFCSCYRCRSLVDTVYALKDEVKELKQVRTAKLGFALQLTQQSSYCYLYVELE